jgi:hypothetical protein
VTSGLQPDNEVRCATCGQWHVVVTRAKPDDHPYVAQMLFFERRGQTFFAGTIGSAARLRPGASREPKPDTAG